MLKIIILGSSKCAALQPATAAVNPAPRLLACLLADYADHADHADRCPRRRQRGQNIPAASIREHEIPQHVQGYDWVRLCCERDDDRRHQGGNAGTAACQPGWAAHAHAPGPTTVTTLTAACLRLARYGTLPGRSVFRASGRRSSEAQTAVSWFSTSPRGKFGNRECHGCAWAPLH